MDLRAELCKKCIHTKVCMKDKNVFGDSFVGGNPMYTDNAELFKKYELWKAAGFPCIDYVPYNQWTPCSERLPGVGQSVLMSVGGMYTAEGCLMEDDNWAQFRWDAVKRKDMVGAWMSLPEPWKGDTT